MGKLTLKGLLGLARTEPATVADAENSRNASAAEVTAAEAGVTEAETAYTNGLLSADDVSLRAFAAARIDAAVRLDRARALLAAFDAQVLSTQKREREAEVARLVSAYEGASAAFRAFVEAELPAMGEKARQMMTLRYAAESARVDAQLAMRRADPDGADTLGDAEAWRSVSGLPEEILDEREVELWLRPNGTPLEPELEHEVKLQSDGTGIRWHGTGQTTRYVQRRRFLRRERLDQGYGAYVPSIATALSIPPLTAGDRAGWVPAQGADLASLAQALQDSQGGKIATSDDREVRVTYEPVSEPFNTFEPHVEVIGGPGQEPARRLA